MAARNTVGREEATHIARHAAIARWCARHPPPPRPPNAYFRNVELANASGQPSKATGLKIGKGQLIAAEGLRIRGLGTGIDNSGDFYGPDTKID
jgi:hypothetical protein